MADLRAPMAAMEFEGPRLAFDLAFTAWREVVAA
ncbi:hypothetical protein ACVIW2_003804 [Bradyrhizobium huanghuaihaiense]